MSLVTGDGYGLYIQICEKLNRSLSSYMYVFVARVSFSVGKRISRMHCILAELNVK